MVVPIINEMFDALQESLDETRARISGVKLGPIEGNEETILFSLDATPYKGTLRGRNRDLVVGFNAECDSSIALRTLLDGDAEAR